MPATATLRRFNRTYTQRIGALEESFLGTGRPLNVSRLLFELGERDGATVTALRERLDLDSGYLSRLLRRLEEDGLAETVTDPADRRRRLVRLTAAGRTARADLDQRSEELADRLLAPLTDRQRARLADALATADLLIRAATVHLREIATDSPIARAAMTRYVAELDRRFPGGFDPGAWQIVETDATYVVATSDGEAVAYGGLRRCAPGTDEIKRMWVDPDWRGAGLGSRMLRHLESLARERRATRVVLDTHGSLTEAIALYERSGYTPIERYNDNPHAEAFFEKRLD